MCPSSQTFAFGHTEAEDVPEAVGGELHELHELPSVIEQLQKKFRQKYEGKLDVEKRTVEARGAGGSGGSLQEGATEIGQIFSVFLASRLHYQDVASD